MPDKEKTAQITKLNNDEENIYVGGYIVYKLPCKIYKTVSADTITEQMTKGASKSSKLDYTQEWMTLQSRGELCFINDVTF